MHTKGALQSASVQHESTLMQSAPHTFRSVNGHEHRPVEASQI